MATKELVRATCIAGLMVMAAAIAQAQTAVGVPDMAAAQGSSPGGLVDLSRRHDDAIVGSWLETISVTGGPTFKSLSTFTSDGAFISHDQGSVITDPAFPHVFSSGHGAWAHQGGRTFTTTFLQLISDLSGGLLYVNTVRQTVSLSTSRDAFRVVWTAEFTDAAGNPVASFQGTSEGRRIKARARP